MHRTAVQDYPKAPLYPMLIGPLAPEKPSVHP
jgi:hypothetical protein